MLCGSRSVELFHFEGDVLCRNEIKQSAGVLFVRGRCGTGNKAEV